MKHYPPREPNEVLDIINLFKCAQKLDEFASLLKLVQGLIDPPFSKELGNDRHQLSHAKYPVLIEIGTYTGGTAAAFSEYCQAVFTIDTSRSLVGATNVFHIQGDSHDYSTKEQLLYAMGQITGKREADILFIDGDHSLAGVAADFELYSKMVKPGGLVAFHDIIDSPRHRSEGVEVADLWEQLKEKYHFIEFKTEPLDWGGIGVIQLPE